MRVWAPILCGLLASLAGCASQHSPTLKNLDDRKVQIEPKRVAGSSKEKAMVNYRAFLQEAPMDHPRYSSALNRLADLEMEAGDNKLLREREEKLVEAYRGAAAETSAPGLDNYRSAIQLYEGLLQANPNDPRTDWILYQLARAYEQTNQLEKSIEIMDKLVKAYPRSDYVLESNFRKGEMYFLLKEYAEAEKSYLQVIARGKSGSFYAKALYKRGWTLFLTERYELAMDSFLALLAEIPVNYNVSHEVDTSSLSRVDKELLSDLFRAISLTFSYAGGVPAASQYFSKHPQTQFEYLVFSQLASYFVKEERVKDATDAIAAFMALQPNHALGPDLQLQRIELLSKSRYSVTALSAREEFVTRFGKQSEFWRVQSPAVRTATALKLKTILQDLTQYYHSTAQRSKRAEDYDHAATWYKTYIEFFGDEPATASQSFMLAELLFEQKKCGQAAGFFEKAAYGSAGFAKANDAAYAALVCYAQLSASEVDKKSEARKKAASAGERFADTFANDPRVPAVLARSAADYYALGDGTKASLLAQRVVAKEAQVDPAARKTSYLIVGHTAFARDDFALAQLSYRKALDLGVASAQEQRDIQERLGAAIYKDGERKRAKGDMAAAAGAFLDVITAAPNSEIGVKSEYDAIAAMLAMEQWRPAIARLESFRTRHPGAEYQLGLSEKLAVAYEKVGVLDKAAVEYEALSQLYRDVDRSRGALWAAGNHFVTAGDQDRATKAFARYVAKYPQPFDMAIEARGQLVELFGKLGRPTQQREWQRDILQADAAAGSQRSDRSKALAALASLSFADDEAAYFGKIALKAPLKKSVKAKKAAMESAFAAYNKAVAYGVESVVTAATYRVADLYLSMGKALAASERPKGLSPQELEEYNLQLEEQAYPFEEKAIALHEENVARVKRGVYDAWVRRSYDALGQLKPARYARGEKGVDAVSSLN